MSKVYSDDLSELIQSLSKTEKKYIKQYASRHTLGGINKSILLFDAIEKQKKYDEGKLSTSVKKITKKNLPDLKHMLYKTILKSLNAFHAANFIDIDIRNRINWCQLLFEKGLYDQCEKQIKKTKELASKYEKGALLMDILNIEKEIIRAKSYAHTSEEKIKQLYQIEYELALKNEETNNKVGMLSTQFFKEIRSKGGTRNKQELDLYNQIFNHDLFKGKETKSFVATNALYNVKSTILSERGKHTEASTNDIELINIIEEKPYFIKAYPRYYMIAINNTIIGLSNLKQHEKIPFYLAKLKNLKIKSSSLQNDLFYLILNRELFHFINTSQFEKALTLIKEFEKRNDKKDSILNKDYETTIYYNCGYIYMATKHYKHAGSYFQKIINNSDTNLLSDIQCFSRILSLICDYESGNVHLLEYSIKSTYRFLLKRKKLYKFETILLNFIRKTAPLSNEKEEIFYSFKRLKSELLPLLDDKFEKQAFDYFDFIGWLDRKIGNKSIPK